LSKDFGSVLLKAEGVLTRDRRVLTSIRSTVWSGRTWSITRSAWTFPFEDESRLQRAVFRALPHRPPDLLPAKRENGMSLLYNHKFAERVEGEVLWCNRSSSNDYMFRPKVIWRVQPNLRAMFGADLFGGNSNGFFGRYGESDRYYGELRYSF
jgi:hypothetical protein